MNKGDGEMDVFEDAPTQQPDQKGNQQQLLGLPGIHQPLPSVLTTVQFPMILSTMTPVVLSTQPPPPPPRNEAVIPPPPPVPTGSSPIVANPYMMAVMESVHNIAPPTVVPAPPLRQGKTKSPAGAKATGGKASVPKLPKTKPDASSPALTPGVKAAKAVKKARAPKGDVASEAPPGGGVSGEVQSGLSEQTSAGSGFDAEAGAGKPAKKRPSAAKEKTGEGSSPAAKRPRQKKDEKDAKDEAKPAVSSKKETATKSPVDGAKGKDQDTKEPPAGVSVDMEPESLAKLECIDLQTKERYVRYVQTVPCILGRAPTRKGSDAKVSGGTKLPHLDLGTNTKLSLEHAELSFNQANGFFELKLLGKNGGLVRGEKIGMAEGAERSRTVSLQGRDPVKLGEVGFYFCLPEVDRPKKQFVELVVEALEAHKARGRMLLSAKEISHHIIEHHPYYNIQHGNERGIVNLIRSIQNAISKSDKVRSISKDKSGRALYELGSKAPRAKTAKEVEAGEKGAAEKSAGQSSSGADPGDAATAQT